MLLANVVETSRRVAETSKRLEKIGLLATLLRQLGPEEIEIVVHFLAGQIRQGRIGIGYAALREVRNSPASHPSLEILDIDRMLESILKTSGGGSERRRLELLQSMFVRATEPEQQFLAGLLMGELRQGALEGIMLEAIAKASGISSERVRRAAMMAGDIAKVARAALEQGEAGLSQYDIQMFRPIQPMLAQSADDIPEALASHRRSGAGIQNGWRARSGSQIGRRRNGVLAQFERCNGGSSGSCRTGARTSSERSDSRWRSDQLVARWAPAAVPNHDAALWSKVGCRANAPGTSHDAVLVRSALLERRSAVG